MGTYRVGQACLNGHAITDDVSSGLASEFCSQCGAGTIQKCPDCETFIRGHFHVEGVIGLGSVWTPPNHCHACGKPYPWTQAKLDAAKEMAEAIEELTEHERDVIAELMPHIIEETPRTKPAGFKLAAIVGKLSGPAKEAFKGLLNEIAIDAGKSSLGLS